MSVPVSARSIQRSAGRFRRIVLVAALVALVPVGFSYVRTMARPSNSSFGIRTVEWLRENGGAGIVSKIESI